MMICKEEIFKELVLYYPTKHLFKNYYLMRDNAYGVMGPSLWGIVKVKKSKNNDNPEFKF